MKNTLINHEALFEITYGLYIVSSGDAEHGNGYISNSVFQVSAGPALFAACCNKNNYTAGLIEKHGHFSVSVLSENTDTGIFSNFGYKSGKDFNKLEGMNIKYGITGVPVVLNNSTAYLECRVIQKTDVGTHWLFIGELLDAQVLDKSSKPMTYAGYRETKKLFAPANAPTYIATSQPEASKASANTNKYKCAVCGYIYDEAKNGVSFNGLPDDWVCPVCGSEKDEFVKF
jgi:flavin reductase (DIM6/NTAB) family NADH-FMN oxidoreductase RutF/rubredoxin